MIVKYHKKFLKAFESLSQQHKKQTIVALEKFQEDPFYKSLHNHGLSGFLAGKRAISVNDDMRIIFKLEKEYLIIMVLDIGTHEKVYKK